MQTVTITTTKKLTTEQLATVKSLVEPKVGKVTINEVIDPNIIGGVRLTIGGQEFDASITGTLEKLDFEVERAVVTSAIALSQDQKKKILSHLDKQYGITEIKEVIDPSVLGGIRIKVDSREVDNTIKHKLGQLKQQLLEKI